MITETNGAERVCVSGWMGWRAASPERASACRTDMVGELYRPHLVVVVEHVVRAKKHAALAGAAGGLHHADSRLSHRRERSFTARHNQELRAKYGRIQEARLRNPPLNSQRCTNRAREGCRDRC